MITLDGQEDRRPCHSGGLSVKAINPSKTPNDSTKDGVM